MTYVKRCVAGHVCSGQIVAAFVAFALFAVSGVAQQPTMVAHFIDTGQADATLLEFPCGAAMIDAGAQDEGHVTVLVNYLNDFFARRSDLSRTIDALFITHTHIDHNLALQAVVQHFKVKRYIDNGMVTGSDKKAAQWIRDVVEHGEFDTKIRSIREDEVQAADHSVGLTDQDIDPLQCRDCDPTIAVLSGSMAENPGWPADDFEDQNNHSLVIRIDFGQASFLFTGDLEQDALDTLVNYYEDIVHQPRVLDVDVYHVGHHGSYNGTTESLLKAMTPRIAVISMGEWSFGKDPLKNFSTWSYGHPRASVVEELERATKRRRAHPVQVHVFERAQKAITVTERDAIYATGWDGTIDIRATLAAKYRVFTSKD